MTKKTTKQEMGRPTAYKKSFARLARIAIEEGGFKITGLCRLLEVKSRTSIYRWMDKHKEFRDAIRAGRKNFEGQKIHKCLVKRALGYRYTETTKELVTTKPADDAKGTPSVQKMVITKKVSKAYPPDVSAIKHYQTNMDPENWTDKKEVKVGVPGEHTIIWKDGAKEEDKK